MTNNWELAGADPKVYQGRGGTVDTPQAKIFTVKYKIFNYYWYITLKSIIIRMSKWSIKVSERDHRRRLFLFIQ